MVSEILPNYAELIILSILKQIINYVIPNLIGDPDSRFRQKPDTVCGNDKF